MDEILQYLYGLERFGIKLGLEVIEQLLNTLDNPHYQFKSIHVVGTCGKGSTAAFLAKILQEAGYNVGLYTSPHLVRFNERIQINRREISDQELIALTQEIKQELDILQPTFFEFTTALAFLYFARKKVDIAIIEAGMGAKLDATNVITPELTILTNVDFDHMAYLGTTLSQIAEDKAAAIKPNVPVVSMEKNKVMVDYFEKVCHERNTTLHHIKDHNLHPLNSSLQGQEFRFDQQLFATTMIGRHQLDNASTAILAAIILQNRWLITPEAIRRGIAATSWSGRLDILSRQPFIIIDGAHNVVEMTAIADFITTIPHRKALLLAIAKDKDIPALVRLIVPLFQQVIISQGNFKPAPTALIAREAKKYTAQIRYHGEFLPCKIKCAKSNFAQVAFSKPPLVASGQSCVIYDKNICLGGGVVL